jgi:hypothetical protein
VSDHEAQHSNVDQHSLQADKKTFIRDLLRVRVPLTQLIDSVSTSRLDQDNSCCETSKKELLALADGLPCTTILLALLSNVAYHVVDEEDAEDGKDNDLQDETSHGDVDTSLGGAAGGGRHAAAGALEGKADDVEGDEDPVDDADREAGELGGEEADAEICQLAIKKGQLKDLRSRQSNINSRSKKHRRSSNAYDLN